MTIHCNFYIFKISVGKGIQKKLVRCENVLSHFYHDNIKNHSTELAENVKIVSALNCQFKISYYCLLLLLLFKKMN